MVVGSRERLEREKNKEGVWANGCVRGRGETCNRVEWGSGGVPQWAARLEEDEGAGRDMKSGYLGAGVGLKLQRGLEQARCGTRKTWRCLQVYVL